MSAAAKGRVDQLLVERGLAESRERAKALVLAGKVFVDGSKADKPGHAVAADSRIEVVESLPFVSRGGLKLAAALDHFRLDVRGWTCLDVGASTGGFTDCLLQRGAARVHAVDVGAGQIAWRLRTDPRVILHERLNARYLRPDDLGEQVQLAVCDVSFISLTLIVPALPPLLRDDGEMVLLVKPQFEVGRGQVGKGGIVRDPVLHRQACRRVEQAVAAAGYHAAVIESPITGAEGNKEFLLHARH
ncbi:MAG: TlyA family RNA methyltransferase [Bryobacteraceae bacterium]|nr:TlyA family RNA methyltransferase [Bryobacteraceae bacterium]